MIMEKYFYATTIINKYGLLHTISIIYMGLLFFYDAMHEYN
jgi:hypothetical protein